MTPETITKIQEALAPMAQKIGEGAEYGWDVLVMGQFAEGLAQLVITTLVAIALVIGLRVTYRVASKVSDDDGEPFAITTWFVLTLFICLILVPKIGVWYWEGVIQTFAPEWSAIKFLISLGS